MSGRVFCWVAKAGVKASATASGKLRPVKPGRYAWVPRDQLAELEEAGAVQLAANAPPQGLVDAGVIATLQNQDDGSQ